MEGEPPKTQPADTGHFTGRTEEEICAASAEGAEAHTALVAQRIAAGEVDPAVQAAKLRERLGVTPENAVEVWAALLKVPGVRRLLYEEDDDTEGPERVFALVRDLGDEALDDLFEELDTYLDAVIAGEEGAEATLFSVLHEWTVTATVIKSSGGPAAFERSYGETAG